ncbi:hypothetical protein C1646_678217 [Rhizophagus diaphanus]|nr:hypothetical protein C1646_678217 [Rhizophagus diaphanus] [Rhizophagus sp. MUCL 43196]
MVTDQNHLFDSTPIEQEVFRYEKIANRIADMDSALSEKMGALDEKMDNYYSEYKKLVKRLDRDVGSLESELDILDKCVDRGAVVDLIHEIVPSLISKKRLKGDMHKDSYYLSESSEESDLVEIIEVREKKDVPHKQRRKARLSKLV